MKPQLSKLDRETKGLKWFSLFTILGWVMVGFSLLVGVSVIAPTGAAYWGGNAKAVRDTAEVGSALLGNLTTLAWWPKLLLPLTILGVTSFMVGIALGFAAIPDILDRRTEVLKKALPLMK